MSNNSEFVEKKKEKEPEATKYPWWFLLIWFLYFFLIVGGSLGILFLIPEDATLWRTIDPITNLIYLLLDESSKGGRGPGLIELIAWGVLLSPLALINMWLLKKFPYQEKTNRGLHKRIPDKHMKIINILLLVGTILFIFLALKIFDL